MILTLLVKGLAGGVLVVCFALISEAVKPQRFAGLFGAAPAVAIASLGVTLATKGAHDAHENTVGMLAGSCGMGAYALLAVPLLRRLSASRAAFVALAGWGLIAGAVAVPLLA